MTNVKPKFRGLKLGTDSSAFKQKMMASSESLSLLDHPFEYSTTEGKNPIQAALIVLQRVTNEVCPEIRAVGLSNLDRLQSLKVDPCLNLLKKKSWRKFFEEDAQNDKKRFGSSTKGSRIHATFNRVKSQRISDDESQELLHKMNEFFYEMVERIEILWRDIRIPKSDAKYYRRTLLSGPPDSLDHCRETARYINLLKSHRQNTIRVCRSIRLREFLLAQCEELLLAIQRRGTYHRETSKLMGSISHRPINLSKFRSNHSNFNVNSHRATYLHHDLVDILKDIQIQTLLVIRNIMVWRRQLWRPQPFVWNGINYLLKIKDDLTKSMSSTCMRDLEMMGILPADLLCVIFPHSEDRVGISNPDFAHGVASPASFASVDSFARSRDGTAVPPASTVPYIAAPGIAHAHLENSEAGAGAGALLRVMDGIVVDGTAPGDSIRDLTSSVEGFAGVSSHPEAADGSGKGRIGPHFGHQLPEGGPGSGSGEAMDDRKDRYSGYSHGRLGEVFPGTAGSIGRSWDAQYGITTEGGVMAHTYDTVQAAGEVNPVLDPTPLRTLFLTTGNVKLSDLRAANKAVMDEQRIQAALEVEKKVLRQKSVFIPSLRFVPSAMLVTRQGEPDAVDLQAHQLDAKSVASYLEMKYSWQPPSPGDVGGDAEMFPAVALGTAEEGEDVMEDEGEEVAKDGAPLIAAENGAAFGDGGGGPVEKGPFNLPQGQTRPISAGSRGSRASGHTGSKRPQSAASTGSTRRLLSGETNVNQDVDEAGRPYATAAHEYTGALDQVARHWGEAGGGMGVEGDVSRGGVGRVFEGASWVSIEGVSLERDEAAVVGDTRALATSSPGRSHAQGQGHGHGHGQVTSPVTSSQGGNKADSNNPHYVQHRGGAAMRDSEVNPTSPVSHHSSQSRSTSARKLSPLGAEARKLNAARIRTWSNSEQEDIVMQALQPSLPNAAATHTRAHSHITNLSSAAGKTGTAHVHSHVHGNVGGAVFEGSYASDFEAHSQVSTGSHRQAVASGALLMRPSITHADDLYGDDFEDDFMTDASTRSRPGATKGVSRAAQKVVQRGFDSRVRSSHGLSTASTTSAASDLRSRSAPGGSVVGRGSGHTLSDPTTSVGPARSSEFASMAEYSEELDLELEEDMEINEHPGQVETKAAGLRAGIRLEDKSLTRKSGGGEEEDEYDIDELDDFMMMTHGASTTSGRSR